MYYNGYGQALDASVYAGKKLSVLGDSISTFAGFIPEGNAVYYTGSNGGVSGVGDTWWRKLQTALQMELLVNNSWSGSRVTTTGGETPAGCMDRCTSLGTSGVDPDVILVFMGINDFNNGVALGAYNGEGTLPEDTTTFREAYAVMLSKLLLRYKYAQVWVCTLPYCERGTNDGFPEENGNGVTLAAWNAAIRELAALFGVKVLEFAGAGITYQNMGVYTGDHLHPNAAGHSLLANQAIRTLDSRVRKRW